MLCSTNYRSVSPLHATLIFEFHVLFAETKANFLQQKNTKIHFFNIAYIKKILMKTKLALIIMKLYICIK